MMKENERMTQDLPNQSVAMIHEAEDHVIKVLFSIFSHLKTL